MAGKVGKSWKIVSLLNMQNISSGFKHWFILVFIKRAIWHISSLKSSNHATSLTLVVNIS